MHNFGFREYFASNIAVFPTFRQAVAIFSVRGLRNLYVDLRLGGEHKCKALMTTSLGCWRKQIYMQSRNHLTKWHLASVPLRTHKLRLKNRVFAGCLLLWQGVRRPSKRPRRSSEHTGDTRLGESTAKYSRTLSRNKAYHRLAQKRNSSHRPNPLSSHDQGSRRNNKAWPWFQPQRRIQKK
jgi:hypothetical protein